MWGHVFSPWCPKWAVLEEQSWVKRKVVAGLFWAAGGTFSVHLQPCAQRPLKLPCLGENLELGVTLHGCCGQDSLLHLENTAGSPPLALWDRQVTTLLPPRALEGFGKGG